MAGIGAALAPSAVIAVIGVGRMGAGIAAVAAGVHHRVLLYDAVEGAAARGRDGVAVDWAALVARGKLSEADAARRLSRIEVVTDLSGLTPADLVIEAIIEDMAIKASLFRHLEAIVGDGTILTTNTSSLSVTALAGGMKQARRFAGFHFFNPAPVMPLVEVIGTSATDPAIVATLVETARSWGKSPVCCAATPGFIVNRVARPFYAESMRLLAEQAADVATLDAVMRGSGLFRMGAFELTDMIGQDVNFAVTKSVYEAFFQDPRYRPSLVQQALVESGALGRKSGRGFYDYAAGAKPPLAKDLPVGPRLDRIVVRGDLGPARALADLAKANGIIVESAAGDGVIEFAGLTLALTDGRTATERSTDETPVVLFDYSPDFAAASRIAIAAPDGAAADVVAQAAGFFQALGKAVSRLDDVPGLLVMRTVAMLVNEALDVVHQAVASAADVDVAMIKGAGYPSGPLAMGKAVGAIRLLAVLETLARAYPESRYRPSPLLRRAAATHSAGASWV